MRRGGREGGGNNVFELKAANCNSIVPQQCGHRITSKTDLYHMNIIILTCYHCFRDSDCVQFHFLHDYKQGLDATSG